MVTYERLHCNWLIGIPFCCNAVVVVTPGGPRCRLHRPR